MVNTLKEAIFAGSFDPFHQGHYHIVLRALKIFDKLVILVANNSQKEPQSSLSSRVEFIKKYLKNLKAVEVCLLDVEYVATFAKKRKIKFLLRSIRNSKDSQSEIELARANKNLNQDLETIILVGDQQFENISSSLLRD